MYFIAVAGFMLLFPLISIGLDVVLNHQAMTISLAGHWYVFWAVGVRLFSAGLKQTIQPSYTAKKILGIEGDDVFLVVRELGFANLSIGAVGLASIYFNEWTLAGALSGGLFYGFAGISHVLHKKRNTLQNVAMVTDLLAATLLLGFFMLTMLVR